MKKILYIIFSIFLLTILVSCSKRVELTQSETETSMETTVASTIVVETTIPIETTEVVNETKNEEINKGENMANPKIEISIKDYGVIQLELDPKEAPITVENFVNLVNNGFYNGLTFHRIIDGFMIQGGDPLGNGTGGSDNNIKGEFFSNGVENNIKHLRGVISMARSMDPDSASSQFFIMHQDAPHLDGQYAAFGHVTSGIEVVDKICENTPVQDGNGTVAKSNQPVIEYIKIIE
ncbi:MAG: peptidylprolyl isomerase [Lachnospiraceae bacterium]|nr:peptidylprolyl isomerase [Lachnospiraceae bacterium]